MEEKLFQLALSLIPKVGPKIAKQLLSYCGSPYEVFKTSAKDLSKIPGIGQKLAKEVSSKKSLKLAEQELKFVESNGIEVLFFSDKSFPKKLKHCHDSPLLLYYKGNFDLNHSRIVSIVGTRKPSNEGLENCERIIEELKSLDTLVISGLAFGIDITAHKKCLDIANPNIAVLGHGLNYTYPQLHKKIAQKIVRNGGLLTEFPSFQKPEREHFPMRNRIIAGLCDALIVIETGEKGGSMITAEFANTYNKDVFAVPGRNSDEKAKGCNKLIKTHKAFLLESAADISYIMRWEKCQSKPNLQMKLFNHLNETEKQVFEFLQFQNNACIDSIANTCQLEGSEIANILLGLECYGLVKTLPGNKFTTIGTS